MKKALLTCLSLTTILFSMAQNLTKVKDAIAAKKYNEANTMIDAFIANPKYEKNVELYYLKAKLHSDIAADAELEKATPNAWAISLDNFKKTA